MLVTIHQQGSLHSRRLQPGICDHGNLYIPNWALILQKGVALITTNVNATWAWDLHAIVALLQRLIWLHTLLDLYKYVHIILHTNSWHCHIVAIDCSCIGAALLCGVMWICTKDTISGKIQHCNNPDAYITNYTTLGSTNANLTDKVRTWTIIISQITVIILY